MIGACPWVIPASWHIPIIDMRERWRPKRLLTRDELIDYNLEIRQTYHEIVDRLLHPTPPVMQNTDGDPIEEWSPDMRPVTRQRLRLSGGTGLSFITAGEAAKPAVLLLHGSPSSARMFREVIPELSQAAYVIAPDLPGFGESDVLQSP